MDNLSKFADVLDYLMFERGLTLTQLAKETGIGVTALSRYLHAIHTPTVENLVILADYFNCTTDFLLGRESENHATAFKPFPLFSVQLGVLKDSFDCPWSRFYKTARISSSRFYEWKNGKRTPSLDSIILLADGFLCTVDFIIGRTAI